MVTERNPAPASCAGVKALIRPWEPHEKCRDCLRYTYISSGVIQPAMKRIGGKFDCANRVVA